MLTEAERANFQTIEQAGRNSDLALMECEDKAGERVPVLCAVYFDEGEYVFVPLARLFTSNPYDDLTPPTP